MAFLFDVSSGNVLLDADFNPLVGEIEMSNILDPSKGTVSISAIAGSLGYIPPGTLLLSFSDLICFFRV